MVTRQQLDAVHRRIRGQLVATPIVGGPCLPGRTCPPGLRVKLDVLQPGGSAWFRGAMHALARRLGSAKGLVVHGAFRPMYAWATAAVLQRVPAIAVVDEATLADPDRRLLLEALDAGLTVATVADPEAAAARATELRARHGYLAASGPGDEEFDDGLATLGLELADALPSEVERVLVAPASLARPIARGLAACGSTVAVAGVDATADRHAARRMLADAVRTGLRVCCDQDGLAALDVALDASDGGRVCVVLAE